MTDFFLRFNWQNLERLNSFPFTCAYCNLEIASERGYRAPDGYGESAEIYICHSCNKPTFIDHEGNQFPGPAFGDTIADIDDKMVEAIYNEARNCCQTASYTAAVLSCRKLLMHIAVANGAKPNLAFTEYVRFLSDNDYVPPGAKTWVEHIRTTGNEANHEIKLMTKDDAEHLIEFVGMLLKMIYEFPAAARRRIPPKPATP